MKYVPQPLFSEEEVSHAICCRNIFIKGCEVCREQHSLKSPGCLGSWSGRRTHPHTGCPAQAQTQMCEWSRIPPATSVPPLDFPFSIRVWLPLPPSQPGSEPLSRLCCLTSLTALYSSSFGAYGTFALN